MDAVRNNWLFASGLLSGVAALLHLGCIVGGPGWYRFFGAGERMARLAERGSPVPALVTLGIAAVLALWAAYALSGAGVIARLPLLRTGLVVVTAIYLARAAACPVMVARMPDRSVTFLAWSSAIVLVFGIVHLIGVVTAWDRLAEG